MRNFTITIFFVFLSSITFAQQASSDSPLISLGAAINISGKQRMLTQRMAKDFVYIGMKINVEAVEKEKNASIILFEENFKALSAYAPTDKIKAHLAKEEVLWREYKKLIMAEPTQENARLIVDKNTSVLMACDELVRAYVEYASALPKKEGEDGSIAKAIAENTNVSGRQRMLSQRLTFYYAAYVWGIGDSTTPDKIKGFADFIKQNFSKLIISEVNTTDIDDALANVIADWREIEERCTSENCFTFENKSIDVAQMIKITSNILQKMDKITGMYAKLLE